MTTIDHNKKIAAINNLLPQTQCGECNYAGCLPYAKAIAENEAPIDKCPPGGTPTVMALAHYLAIDASPYLTAMEKKAKQPSVVRIREFDCIGCTKCIKACPVDAIMGAAKQMHTVITAECTGCELCVTPCPVDCIDIVPLGETFQPIHPARSALAKERYENRNERLKRLQAERQAKHQKAKNNPQLKGKTTTERRKDYMAEALMRVRKKKEK
ncbi:MAG: RnfABCDGE type electron transport complex subunit B [Gammaproteobacteria bacterium]